MPKVPLVIYKDGERIVLGESKVVVKNGDIFVESVVFDKDKAPGLTADGPFSIGFDIASDWPVETTFVPPLKVKEDQDEQG